MSDEQDKLTEGLSRLKISPTSRGIMERYQKGYQHFLEQNPGLLNNSKYVGDQDKTGIYFSPVCYKHAFGRNWSTKADLANVVERPERIVAASIGATAAATLYPSHYTMFAPGRITPLDSPHILGIHGKEWPEYLKKVCLESDAKLAAGQIEVPDSWSSGDMYVVKGTLDALQGAIGTVETAIDNIHSDDGKTPKRAFTLIRPPGHHSHPCAPSGFCLINNVQIGIEYAAAKHGVTHAVILDIDLHHGDGSQAICWKKAGFPIEDSIIPEDETKAEANEDDEIKKESEELKVGYFSLHDINSYPVEPSYATPDRIKNASTCLMAHDLAIWNVHLEPYETEEEFYTYYTNKYSQILKKADEFLSKSKKSYEKDSKNESKPFKAMIAISAGFDASEYEVKTMQRHDVNVPTSFYAKFTSDAVKLAHKHTDGRLLSILEGGYSDGALVSGVFSHLVGLQCQKWDYSWGKPSVIKELTKGCRPKWSPVKHPGTEEKKWANQVCELGRTLLPESFFPPQSDDIRNTPAVSGSRVLRSRTHLPPKTAPEVKTEAPTTPQVEAGRPQDSIPTPLQTPEMENRTLASSETTGGTAVEPKEGVKKGDFIHRAKLENGQWKLVPKDETQ